MREMRDSYDQAIALGDAILYAVKQSTTVSQQYAFIYGIETYNDGYRLKVVAVHRTWRGKLNFYKTVLTARNFIKIPMNCVPLPIKNELLKRLP